MILEGNNLFLSGNVHEGGSCAKCADHVRSHQLHGWGNVVKCMLFMLFFECHIVSMAIKQQVIKIDRRLFPGLSETLCSSFFQIDPMAMFFSLSANISVHL